MKSNKMTINLKQQTIGNQRSRKNDDEQMIYSNMIN